jgi:hypothetical protein
MSQRLVGYGVSQVPTNGMLGGMAYQDPINVTVNNISVGSGTLTGTASQPLQVTGGAYVSGNLGIGVTNPGAKLSVYGDLASGTSSTSGSSHALTISGSNSSSANHVINFNGHPNGTNDSVTWYLNRAGGAYGIFDVQFNGSSRFNISGGSLSNSGNITLNPINNTVISSGNLLIATSSSTGTASQPLQVTGGAYVSGNFGIGTTNPPLKLTVVGNIKAGYEAATGIVLGITPVGLPTNDVNSYILWGDNATFGGANGDLIYISRTSTDTSHRFYTGTTTPQERLRITSTGNVGIGTINPQYKLHVVGSFAATTKSFVIDHPTKPNYKLRYASLEGEENGVYVRGRTTENIIELPEYWTELVDKNSITVNLTPIGNKHIWIEEINNNKVYIDSNSSIDCFYTVFAERKDVEKLVVEIEEN